MSKNEFAPRHLLIVGPPGAGKGTQAERIVEALNIPAISTGDIFRANVGEGTELGKLAKSYMDRGEYVPDEVTNAMVKDRLSQPDAKDGFLLDGYPRTLAQVTALDEMLEEIGTKLDAVIELQVDHEAVVQRLLERGKVQGRSDDNEETIRRRLEVYSEQTTPLIEVYTERGLVDSVDGSESIDRVTEKILRLLGCE